MEAVSPSVRALPIGMVSDLTSTEASAGGRVPSSRGGSDTPAEDPASPDVGRDTRDRVSSRDSQAPDRGEGDRQEEPGRGGRDPGPVGG